MLRRRAEKDRPADLPVQANQLRADARSQPAVRASSRVTHMQAGVHVDSHIDDRHALATEHETDRHARPALRKRCTPPDTFLASPSAVA
ncbi:hypothetical protein XHV734_4857 [Xanthomonas hortorum pv. vitians]|nr:hypothetical protein XHV734_4857 [Xanthomonas hortorum pv. vitians]